MKFIGKNRVWFIFFNGKYYFGLSKQNIENGWNRSFMVNNVFDLDHDPKLIEIYPRKEISKKEINEQIQIVRNTYPELLL